MATQENGLPVRQVSRDPFRSRFRATTCESLSRDEFMAAFPKGGQVPVEGLSWLARGKDILGLEVARVCANGTRVVAAIPCGDLHDSRRIGRAGEDSRWLRFPARVDTCRFEHFGRGVHSLNLASVDPRVARLRGLLAQIEALLRGKHARIELVVAGVQHVGNVAAGEIPGLVEADLVTLELPPAPVKAFLAGSQCEPLKINNVFWLDVLRAVRHAGPRLGAFGLNVNPYVRSARRRLHYTGRGIVNDFAAPPCVVRLPAESTFRLCELGGSGGTQVDGDEILRRLPEAARLEYQDLGVVHVPPEANPFGPGRHLIVTQGMEPALTDLADYCTRAFEPFRSRYSLSAGFARVFALGFLVEGFLACINDYYLVEALLVKLRQSAAEMESGGRLRALHVTGMAHVDLLLALLQVDDCSGLEVTADHDRRSPAYRFPWMASCFADEVEWVFRCIEMEGKQVVLHLGEARALVSGYLSQRGAEALKQMLVTSVLTPDPETTPTMAWTPDASPAERRLLLIDCSIAEIVLNDQEPEVLGAIYRSLAEGNQVGRRAAIFTELTRLGYDLASFAKDPRLAPAIEDMERLLSA